MGGLIVADVHTTAMTRVDDEGPLSDGGRDLDCDDDRHDGHGTDERRGDLRPCGPHQEYMEQLG